MAKTISAKKLGEFLEANPNWTVQNQKLRCELKFPDFATALKCTNAIGQIAEELNHHPDIFLAWGKVIIEIWTHSINGLSDLDLELASKLQLECADS